MLLDMRRQQERNWMNPSRMREETGVLQNIKKREMVEELKKRNLEIKSLPAEKIESMPAPSLAAAKRLLTVSPPASAKPVAAAPVMVGVVGGQVASAVAVPVAARRDVTAGMLGMGAKAALLGPAAAAALAGSSSAVAAILQVRPSPCNFLKSTISQMPHHAKDYPQRPQLVPHQPIPAWVPPVPQGKPRERQIVRKVSAKSRFGHVQDLLSHCGSSCKRACIARPPRRQIVLRHPPLGQSATSRGNA